MFGDEGNAVKRWSRISGALGIFVSAETELSSGGGDLSSRCAGQQLVPIVVEGHGGNASSEKGRERSKVSCNKKVSNEESAAKHAGGEMLCSGHLSSYRDALVGVSKHAAIVDILRQPAAHVLVIGTVVCVAGSSGSKTSAVRAASEDVAPPTKGVATSLGQLQLSLRVQASV